MANMDWGKYGPWTIAIAGALAAFGLAYVSRGQPEISIPVATFGGWLIGWLKQSPGSDK